MIAQGRQEPKGKDKKETRSEQLGFYKAFSEFVQPIELYNVINSRKFATGWRVRDLRSAGRRDCFVEVEIIQQPISNTGGSDGRGEAIRAAKKPRRGGALPDEPLASGEHPSETSCPPRMSFSVILCRRTESRLILWPLQALVVHFTEENPLKATARLPLPSGASTNDLAILVVCEEDRPILENLYPVSGSTLPANMTCSTAFGLLDHGSRVAAAVCPAAVEPCMQAKLEPAVFTIHGIARNGFTVRDNEVAESHAISLEPRQGASLSCTVTARLCHRPEASATASGSDEEAGMLGVVRDEEGPRPQTMYFRFLFDKGQRYFNQKVEKLACPFCPIRCICLKAMQQHVEACHALLRYTFPEDHPDVVPAVNVRCTQELGQLSSRFNEPWIPLQKRKGRDFAFHYPASMRKLRRSQYSMSGREFGSLPAFATTVLKDVVDGEDLADVVDELSLEKEKAPQDDMLPAAHAPVIKRKRKPKAVAPPAHEDFRLGRRVVFNARSKTPKTVQEVVSILNNPRLEPDSDDESNDFLEWSLRQRNSLMALTEHNMDSKEFMYNWDVYLHQNVVHADFQMAEACRRFCQRFSVRLSQDRFRSCLTFHLANLWEFGLVDSALIDECLIMITTAQEAAQQPEADSDAEWHSMTLAEPGARI